MTGKRKWSADQTNVPVDQKCQVSVLNKEPPNVSNVFYFFVVHIPCVSKKQNKSTFTVIWNLFNGGNPGEEKWSFTRVSGSTSVQSDQTGDLTLKQWPDIWILIMFPSHFWEWKDFERIDTNVSEWQSYRWLKRRRNTAAFRILYFMRTVTYLTAWRVKTSLNARD